MQTELRAQLLQLMRDGDPFATPYLNQLPQHLNVTAAQLKEFLDRSSEFRVYQRRSPRQAFQVVGIRLEPAFVALLAPIEQEKLCRSYKPERDQLNRAVQSALHLGLVQIQEGVLCSAQGRTLISTPTVNPHPEPPDPPPDPRTQALAANGSSGSIPSAQPPPARPPVHPPRPDQLSDFDFVVLRHLEDLEQARINFGLYETFVTVDELLTAIRGDHPQFANLDRDAVWMSVARLAANWYAMLLPGDNGAVRSRISEIVRLLKNVKQRFRQADAGSRPFLMQSLRVHFQDRRRLRWVRPLRTVTDQLFHAHRQEVERLDLATRCVRDGFALALGRTPDGDDQPQVTGVQERSIHEIGKSYLQHRGSAFVITGNTGSGKTEAALLPLLIGALQEKMTGVEGCKILLIYPRQALAKNQLDRLVRYLAAVNQRVRQTPLVSRQKLSAGIVFQETPWNQHALEQGAGSYQSPWDGRGDGRVLPYFTSEDGSPVLAREFRDGTCTLTGTSSAGDWQFTEFRATRDAIAANPPDVLIITTEMLHRWLMDPKQNAVFGLADADGSAPAFCAPRAVVCDEIHLHDGIAGAQIGLLLRRLQHRITQAMRAWEGSPWRFPLLIGMSATIGNPARFWQELSGARWVNEVSPDENDFGEALGRDYFLFLRPESFSRGKRVGDASAAIQAIMTVAHNMRRRGASGDDPAKYRGLVFQDSISKLKKLALEFRDAEMNLRLASLRWARPAGPDPLASAVFHDGEFWHFDVQDPEQYSELRRNGAPPAVLTCAANPVFSGSGRNLSSLLERDIIFATTALEVGYDDPSIQFVLQHHAPKNPASFVQKRGRAGRSLNDRPITAVTLSRSAFKDAFYYQNPALLYDPSEHNPPLNVSNYFVERFQTVCLIFDELARVTGHNYQAVGADTPTDVALQRADRALPAVTQQVSWAYQRVTSDSFRRVHPRWQDVWAWFKDQLSHDPVAAAERFVARDKNLLARSPDLPKNLFGAINLPAARVLYPRGPGRDDDGAWGEDNGTDIALVFGEIAPGKVTRRYGRNHRVHWRDPRPQVALERFKPDRGGPFDPHLLRPLAQIWGENWHMLIPRAVRRVHNGVLPEVFYRLRSVEIWDFGTINPNQPRQPQPDWNWFGRFLADGSVEVRYDGQGDFRRLPEVRHISPDSTSVSLSFSVAFPAADGGHVSQPQCQISLPALFPHLAGPLQFYFADVGERRSALTAFEAHYGADATVVLQKRGPNDPHGGVGHNRVAYVSEHQQPNVPTLYGYGVTTEGVRLPYDRNVLHQLAGRLFEHLWGDAASQNEVQEQFLQYLLKSEPWPTAGVDQPLGPFDMAHAAGIVSTLRALSREAGEDIQSFLDAITRPSSLRQRLDVAATTLWRDHRVLGHAGPDTFRSRLEGTLTGQRCREFLGEVFARIVNGAEVKAFLADTLIHSLKHGLRNLFLLEGSVGDEEVSSHGVLPLIYGRAAVEDALYVFERNQDGNGATRLFHESLASNGPQYLLRQWSASALRCPVGDEEDFVRFMTRNHREVLLHFTHQFAAVPAHERPNPRDFVQQLVGPWFRADDERLEQFAGILVAEVSFGGNRVSRFQLTVELLDLESELAQRFHRAPIAEELAGHAAMAAEIRPREFPGLAALLALYQQHAQDLADDDGDVPEVLNPLDRFLMQVMHLDLSTCRHACPACLANRCDQGWIDTTRHVLSRRHLELAHRYLTEPFTRHAVPTGAGAALQVDQLVQLATDAGGRWLVVETREASDPEFVRSLRDAGFDHVGRMLDLHREAQPVARDYFHLRA